MIQEEKSCTRICTSQSDMLLAACTVEDFNRKTICAFMQVGCADLKVKSKGNIRINFYFFLKAPFLLAYINLGLTLPYSPRDMLKAYCSVIYCVEEVLHPLHGCGHCANLVKDGSTRMCQQVRILGGGGPGAQN